MSSKLHITIGSSPADGMSLDKDLRMVKAALLYADQTKLCSLTSSMVLQVLALADLNETQQLEFMAEMFPYLISDPHEANQKTATLRLLINLYKKKRRSKEELLFVMKMKREWAVQWEEMKEAIQSIAEQSGSPGIIKAVNSGLLEIHVFESRSNDYIDGLANEYFDVVGQAISDNSTYPMLDAQTGDLISAAIKEGVLVVSNTGVTRSKQAGIIANLFERLPLFDKASIEEILDIRSELEKPLIRFRSAIIKYGEYIKSAAWAPDFLFEADQLYRREIEPAILEIEEAYKSSSYLRVLAGKATEPLATTTALGVAVSQLSQFLDLTQQSLLLGVGGGKIAYDTYIKQKGLRDNLEQNQLYFYYRVGKKLEKLK